MAEMDQDAAYGEAVGERLRKAREAQGLTLDDVAARTRIPIRHLRSIEDSQWDDLPAVTYTVGFARNYANAVGLDGAEIGRELREQLGAGSRASQLSAEIYAPPDPARVPSRSLAWVAAVLLVVLVAAYLIWRSQLDDGAEPVADAPPAAEESAQVQPQQTQPPQPTPQDLAGQPVTLVATDTVWFQVNDRAAGDRRLHSGELRAGQSYAVPSDARQPVIRTGRPQVLTVRVGARDLGPLAAEERTISNVSLLPADLAASIGGQPQAPAAPDNNVRP